MLLKNKFFSILAVTIGVVAFSTFALAQEDKAVNPNTGSVENREGRDHRKFKGEGFEGRHHGKHGGMMRMLHGIDLTDAQKEQIKSIMEANKPDQTTMDEMRTLGRAKHDGTITAAQQTRLTAMKEQAKASAKLVHEQIMNILTVEQKAQIEQRKTEMKQRFEERRQKRQQIPAATTSEAPQVG